MTLINLIPINAWAKDPQAAFVELAKTQNGTMGAYFPFDWMLTAAISSPVAMVFIWIFKEWWDSNKGWKKEVREDMRWLRDNFHKLEAKVGDDLDEKIERKISHALNLYGRSR